MKIHVYVEGVSDKLGLEMLLRHELENWRSKHIGLKFIQLGGKNKLMSDIGRRAQLALDQDAANHVFALVDLYPGHTNAESLRHHLRGLIEPRLRPSFHAHVAVHDFEAWVLGAQEPLCKRLGVTQLTGFGSPELVDNQKPPAEHLKELFARYKRTFQKELDGPAILSRTTPAIIAEKCPHFLFYQDLLNCTEQK